MDKPDISVSEVTLQEPIGNAFAHSVRFDISATDSETRFYNAEIQNANDGELMSRSDYCGSAIRMKNLGKNADYRHAPKVYDIFAVKNGKFCKERPINRILMRDDLQEIYEVGTPVYFVSGKLKDASPSGMHRNDFFVQCRIANARSVIADRFREAIRKKTKMDAI